MSLDDITPEQWDEMGRRWVRAEPKTGINDPVNSPNHYNKGNIECIDAIEAAVSDLSGLEAVCTANALKYIWRWKHKNGNQDISKAIWYLNKLLEINA